VTSDLAIVGSSIVYWAERRARSVRAKWSLLTATTTHWDGRRGMVWSQLNAACERMATANKHPRWLIIHLGGNDLASTPLKTLIQKIQKDVMSYSKFFPQTCIIWSDILPRATYRGAISNAKVEKSRKSLNNSMKLYMPRINGAIIQHRNIQWDAHHLYRKDGVHLNDAGNDVMLGNITQAMMTIIASQ
jgi:lysophospholipase L1-like esterase